MPSFMFAPRIVAMKLSMLNFLSMRLLALDLLCTFQISIQIIDMSDFGKTLMILGFEARMTLLKIWLLFKILSMLLEVIQVLVL